MNRSILWLLMAVALLPVAAVLPQAYPVLPRWETTHVDAQPSRSGLDAHHALALDSDDRPHVANFDANTGSLIYAHLPPQPAGDVWGYDVIDSFYRQDNHWRLERVGSNAPERIAYSAALAVGSDDQPRLSFN